MFGIVRGDYSIISFQERCSNCTETMTGLKNEDNTEMLNECHLDVVSPIWAIQINFKALIVKFICGDVSHNMYEWGLYAFHVNPGSTSDIGNFSGIFLSSSAKRR